MPKFYIVLKSNTIKVIMMIIISIIASAYLLNVIL